MREQVNCDDLARLPLSLDMSPFRFDLHDSEIGSQLLTRVSVMKTCLVAGHDRHAITQLSIVFIFMT